MKSHQYGNTDSEKKKLKIEGGKYGHRISMGRDGL